MMLRKILLALAVGTAPAHADQITIFAAASLGDVLGEIGAAFEDATGHEVVTSFAGSSVLARQIEQGAPADIFLSANRDWMDRLIDAGTIDPTTEVDLLENHLVLIGTGTPNTGEIDPDFDLTGRLGDAFLAMALVDAVPAGIYGKTALESLGLWDDVQDRVAQSDNVRTALALVATGEAPLGIVYATDAKAETRVGVIGTFPADSHPRIVYPAAAVMASDNPLNVEFLAFLTGPEARDAFEGAGFTVIAD